MNHPASAAKRNVLLASIVATMFTGTSAWSLVLVEDGKARCVIVVPREDQRVIEAAVDLQDHLWKMSGAEVPLVHDANKVDAGQGVGIYIDTMPLNVNVPGRLIDRKMLWPDGYVIEILEFGDTGGVFLSSPKSEGLPKAVYGLLEDHLGCHWFTPGEIGVHVPQRQTVTLKITGNREIARPRFEKRMPWYNDRANRYLTREETTQLVKWYRRNRSGGVQGTQGHAWEMFDSDAFKRIPELGPLVDGQRKGGNGLCLSHPRVVDIAGQWFIKFFDAHPQYDHWSFCQGDSMQFCECDRCKAMGSNHGAHMLIMSNGVMEMVRRVHPTKRIAIMPYEATLEPPQELIPANPNLNPIIVSKGVDQILAKPDSPEYRGQVERWMTMLPRAWSYDYISWMSGPWPLYRSLQETRDFYTRVGYTGVMDEYLGRNLGTDTHLWLSLRMAWDADLRVDDLLNEFYRLYFGAAADDMRWVYGQIEKQMLAIGPVGADMSKLPRIYPIELVDECLARVTRAKQKVSNSPTLVARVERDENCLKATQLWLRFFSTLGQANRGVGGMGRQEAKGACRTYLDFVEGLNGKLTLGGGGMRLFAERIMNGLAGTGTYITKGMNDRPLPGPFAYYDTFDEGGKLTDAKSWLGFRVGPQGLYLKPHTVGEIIYDVRTTEDLQFKEVFLPGARTGWDTRIRLALPDGGHNQVQVSRDQGRTWITAFEDLDTSIPVIKYDLTPFAGGTNRFLLKFRVENTEKEILALDSWVIQGVAEPAERSRE